jgi:hypothetical protein
VKEEVLMFEQHWEDILPYIQGMHPFMDGHYMFYIYGTLIIVIIYSYTISSLMKKKTWYQSSTRINSLIGGPEKIREIA